MGPFQVFSENYFQRSNLVRFRYILLYQEIFKLWALCKSEQIFEGLQNLHFRRYLDKLKNTITIVSAVKDRGKFNVSGLVHGFVGENRLCYDFCFLFL